MTIIFHFNVQGLIIWWNEKTVITVLITTTGRTLSSHYQSLTSLLYVFYVTHAARALQSYDPSVGEGIQLWVTYILFDHTRTWRASPDEGSTQCRGHFRHSTNMKDDTHQAHIHSHQQGEYEIMIMAARWHSGTFLGLKIPDIYLTGEEKLRKISRNKAVPTGDRTRGRSVADATACSTAVE